MPAKGSPQLPNGHQIDSKPSPTKAPTNDPTNHHIVGPQNGTQKVRGREQWCDRAWQKDENVQFNAAQQLCMLFGVLCMLLINIDAAIH